ncbi:MAG: hypothetical protein ACJ73N_15870 [Bryobacteraceae bacterium]
MERLVVGGLARLKAVERTMRRGVSLQCANKRELNRLVVAPPERVVMILDGVNEN